MEFEILYLIQELRSPFLDKVMTGLSFLGNAGWCWIALTAVMLIGRKTRTGGMAMAWALAVGFLIGNVWLKNWVARPRPCWLDPSVSLLVAVPADYSFPSGHTLIGTAAGASLFLWNRKAGIWALILAALIGFSRLYLFVHFPTDVLAGGCLGFFIALAVHRGMEKADSRKRKGEQR